VLTEEKVCEIFELYESTIRFDPDRWTHRKIANELGVDRTTVGKILARKLWAHLALPPLRYDSAA
jgi:hypothetical protein